MYTLSRRRFLAASAAAGALGAVPSLLLPRGAALAAAEPMTAIRATTRVIDVNGRAATVFGLVQPDGTPGLVVDAGRRFRVRLENTLAENTLIHWHGLTPPFRQDGVPGVTQGPLASGAYHDYDFPLERPGTNWMHSHHGLQEQRLMAAPLIVRDPAEAGEDVQEVVVMTHDFTFRDPAEVLASLRGGDGGHGAHGAAPVVDEPADAGIDHSAMGHSPVPSAGAMDHSAMGHGAMDQGEAARPAHLHDVEYDAFLANDRTLADPEVVRVAPGGRVRLRLINAATTTHFWVDLGALEGALVAVDGMPVQSVSGRRFEFATAQRLDILLALPDGQGAWPAVFVREGDDRQTGVVLATAQARVRRIADRAHQKSPPVGLDLERRLRARNPLPVKAADRHHVVTLTEHPDYGWGLNGAVYGEHVPLAAAVGERVEITFRDQTSMAHPMHLHEHHFQVVAIDGVRIAGALRDTVLVPSGGSVTIAFEAGNPGEWMLHCHNLMHMAAGMMTSVTY